MNSALEDLIIVLEWLSATKTPTNQVAEALKRLHDRANSKIPMDVKVDTNPSDDTS